MSQIRFKSIDEVYAKYPTNSLPKFKKIVNRYGFTDDEAKDYFATKVVHDQSTPTPKFMYIYSKVPHVFQMDTFIDHKGAVQPNYLMFINVNTCKTFAYEMRGNGAKEVL